jgi:hypothetical protein
VVLRKGREWSSGCCELFEVRRTRERKRRKVRERFS